MKIESIYHSKNDRRKERSGDILPKKYAKDEKYHPFMLEREYMQALNATKVDRLLAKPFLALLCHFGEGINGLVKDNDNPYFITSSYDNQATLWNMHDKKKISGITYESPIKGIAIDSLNNLFITQNKTVLMTNDKFETKTEFKAGSLVNGIAFTRFNENIGDLAVATTSDLKIFDINRAEAKTTYKIFDSTMVKFNNSFRHLMGSVRPTGINLYDNRSCKELVFIEAIGSNCIEFNPQQGFIFAVGNEDGNSYSYDLRNTEKPLGIYRGHANAVVSLAFNPNGKELATGSYDKTIRIFNTENRKSRDCYYNQRMQIVHGVAYSNDGKFIISGSDDGCLRLWKSQASKKIGPISKREREAMQYKEALKEKFKDVADISRISKHRFLPKEIKQANRQKHEMYEAQLRRDEKMAKNEEQEE